MNLRTVINARATAFRTDLDDGLAQSGWLPRTRRDVMTADQVARPALRLRKQVKIAFVGTGYVADYYMKTTANHGCLSFSGAFDRDPFRLKQFCSFYKCRAYCSLDELLADPEVDIVVNLTPPESHHPISRAALRAGKHVYCEKPFTLDFAQARELVELADDMRLTISAAPASHLGDAYRLVAGLVADGAVGRPQLVYAEMEDGSVYRERWMGWRSDSGAPWPGLQEFELGCTLEHSGYPLTWLVSLFGSVAEVSSFAAVTAPDKGVASQISRTTPDFSVGCLVFKSGLIARLTCGLTAKRDRSLTIFGDKGSIRVSDIWDNRSAVYLERFDQPKRALVRLACKLEAVLGRHIPLKPLPGRRIGYPRAIKRRILPAFPSRIDFSAGIAEQAHMILSGDYGSQAARLALHVTELALTLARPDRPAAVKPLDSTLDSAVRRPIERPD